MGYQLVDQGQLSLISSIKSASCVDGIPEWLIVEGRVC